MSIALTRRSLIAAALGAQAGLVLPAWATSNALRAPVKLTDAAMLDVRSGRETRLVSGVMRDRVVALNFFFTGCSTVCPIQTMALTRAQKHLGKALGPKVVLVSISIDWYGDTVQNIRRFATAHAAGPHWHFLKAPAVAVDRVREGFDAYAPQRDNHPPVLAIGRAGSERWSRLFGLPTGDAIADEISAWLD